MTELTVRAPAKVNLCLSVLAKRPDGYHEVEMVMQMVGLFDEVTVRLAEQGVSIDCDSGSVPGGEGNIAWRAADELLRSSGAGNGLAVSIAKRIPVAAGLGGGSSDAAAVLYAGNRLLGAGLGREELSRLGARLGMDVPFFFHGPCAFARGRGEVLEELPPPPPFWVLLVNPGFGTSTAWAYQNLKLGLTKQADCNKIPRLTVRSVAEGLRNDLEAVTAGAHPVIGEIRQALLQAGAAGARMSGSGPTVFGVFATEADCRRAEGALAARGWWTAAAEALAEPPYRV